MSDDIERRFRIGIISDNEIRAHAETMKESLKNALPSGTQVISQQEDFESASVMLKLHNPEWDIVPLGCELEKFVIELGKIEKKVKLVYGH